VYREKKTEVSVLFLRGDVQILVSALVLHILVILIAPTVGRGRMYPFYRLVGEGFMYSTGTVGRGRIYQFYRSVGEGFIHSTCT
jgi:hypothetical protein